MNYELPGKNLEFQVKEKAYNYGIAKPQIPDYIAQNLKFDLWFWQKSALEIFLTNEEVRRTENQTGAGHLMFNMATGTGKTLLMAALILYYYKNGYRHFLFFVNQKIILGKAGENFINKSHPKYLFRQNIIVGDKIVNIREVENFDGGGDIQIKFTSIHKLHNAVYLPRENSTTLADLQKRNLILIADEAHHLNAATIKRGQAQLDLPQELKENAGAQDIERSWEDTIINKILNCENKNSDENKNVLLEFTATIPQNREVLEKYKDKIIYQFKLADFLNAGYTKEINLVSTSLDKKEKILLALLFNWYRHQIALQNGIANFKPVILFRSKFIEDSKGDYSYFLDLIAELNVADFDFFQKINERVKIDRAGEAKIYEQGMSRILQMAGFIKSEKIKFGDIVKFIKDEFCERNCLITNSKTNKAVNREKTDEDQEKLLNSLEDKNNHIRAIFTVKRLTEGWDVLNLFDIVRLYTGRDESGKNGKRTAGQATIQETQLIGRGVRYFPFAFGEFERGRRKFDKELANPMRVLEEFYYHSDNDARYLGELKNELKNHGYINDDRVLKCFGLKKEFKKTEFFKEVKIWKNEKIENPKRKKTALAGIKNDFICEYELKELAVKEEKIFTDEDEGQVLAQALVGDKKTISTTLKEFERHIIAKAINIKAAKDLSWLRFCNLKNELNIAGIDELIDSRFAGDLKITIIVPQNKNGLEDISNAEKLGILLEFFERFAAKLKEIANPYLGTTEFMPFSFEQLFGLPKEKSVVINPESRDLETDLLKNKWYVLDGFNGTGEERELLKFLKNKIGNLREKYDKVYLLRNEEIYKIYDFKQGRGFQPDFLLFLKGNNGDLYYQVFIEPKGGQFADISGGFWESREGWKEEFLKEISEKYGSGDLLKAENKKYRMIGLPLFNRQNSESFDEIFNRELLK
jgi:type III restriction enzyme